MNCPGCGEELICGDKGDFYYLCTACGERYNKDLDPESESKEMAQSQTVNRRLDPDGNLESRFRYEVRDALDMDMFTRDFQIVEEIKRLKKIEKNLALTGR